MTTVCVAQEQDVSDTTCNPPDCSSLFRKVINPVRYTCDSTEEHGEWVLIFEDEFNGTTLDTSLWYTCHEGWDHTHGKSELQYYQDENITIENGILKLTAKDKPGEYNVWESVNGKDTLIPRHFDYTSGWIETKSKIRYGLIEARCRIPKGDYLWPAMWLFGNSMETDVFEFCGHNPNKQEITIHNWINDTTDLYCNISVTEPYSFADDFHVFSLEWDEFKMIYRVDNEIQTIFYHYGNGITDCESYNNTNSINDFIVFSTLPQKLIFNLAVDSTTGCKCDSCDITNTVLPASLEIDYVRIYKRANPNKEINIHNFCYDSMSYYTGKTIQVAPNDDTIDIGTAKFAERLHLRATDLIVLHPGFSTSLGGVFSASIIANEDILSIPLSYNYNNQTISTKIMPKIENISTTNNAADVFDLYPNPSNGIFTVNYSPNTYQDLYIINELGQVIFHLDLRLNEQSQITLANYNSGIYTVIMTDESKIYAKKLIIQTLKP